MRFSSVVILVAIVDGDVAVAVVDGDVAVFAVVTVNCFCCC